MKTKFLLLVLFLATTIYATAEFSKDGEEPYIAEITWDSKTVDLANVKQNKPVQAKFVFVNKGEKPAMITKVKSSCGCTVASYDKEPVMPGEKGVIIASYNAKRKGSFRKSVTVYLCDNSTHMLVLKGNVK